MTVRSGGPEEPTIPAYVLLTARPSVQAQLLAGALRAEGLRVALDRDSLGVVYALDSGQFATRVLVHPEDAERARALLAEIEGGGD